MPRTARIALGGFIFHVLNRTNGRQPIFDKPPDYAAFEPVVVRTMAARPMRLTASGCPALLPEVLNWTYPLTAVRLKVE